MKNGEEILTNIADMGKLAETLLPQEPEDLLMFNAANSMLEVDGATTTVNGLDTVATRSSYPVKFGEKKLFVRLGREVRGESYGDLSFLLCESNDFDFITTPNGYFSNLQFNFSAGTPLLITGTGTNHDTKDPMYRGFAQEVIDGLTKAHTASRREQQSAEIAAKRAAEDQARKERIIKKQNRSQLRNSATEMLSIGAVILGIAYAPQAIWHGRVDSKVGPIPMPWPVEFVQDTLNHNKSIHQRAQRFKFPSGALPVELGSNIKNIPIISTYETADVPSTHTAVGGMVGSQPGMYKYDFYFGGVIYDVDDACKLVPGNYRDGKTVVFSQNRNVNEMVELRLDDTEEVKVCRRADTKDDATGSLYFYQQP